MRGAPRIDRWLDQRVMRSEGALGQLELAQEHSSGFTQSGDNRRIMLWTEVLVDGHAGRGWNVLGMKQVLHRDRNAMQWTTN